MSCPMKQFRQSVIDQTWKELSARWIIRLDRANAGNLEGRVLWKADIAVFNWCVRYSNVGVAHLFFSENLITIECKFSKTVNRSTEHLYYLQCSRSVDLKLYRSSTVVSFSRLIIVMLLKKLKNSLLFVFTAFKRRAFKSLSRLTTKLTLCSLKSLINASSTSMSSRIRAFIIVSSSSLFFLSENARRRFEYTEFQ